jgi:hypothetical protein
MRKPPFAANRRVYLQGLSAAAISTWLAACGGGGDVGAGPVATATNVTGSLNVSEIGGSQLKVFSVFDGLADVVGGSFKTKVSDDVVQALLVSDGDQKLRAMSIHGSGRPLAVDATSTAIAIVFLTPGISTLDKATGLSRLLAIQAAPGFAAFVQLLKDAMLTQDLPTALAVPAIRAARDVVVAQVHAPIEARAKERPQQEANQSQSDGYVVLTKDDASTDTQLKIQLSNEGFRFVKVVRKEEFNGLNQLAVPVLQGSPTNNSIVGGRAGVSISSFLSLFAGGQLGAPGGASDVIDQTSHKAERLTYYVRGLGNPLHADDTAFPADVQSLMEAEGSLHLGMTVFFYFLLPVIEPILAAFTKITPEEALSIVGRNLGNGFTVGATEAGFISTATALQAGDQAGFLVALGDLIIGLTPVMLKVLAGAFAQLVPGVIQIEAALTAVGAAIATVNFSIAGVAFFRTPQRANAELVLGAPIHFLDQLIATDSRVKFVNLTTDGSLVYSWLSSPQTNVDRRINRLRIPPLGSPYQPEVTFDLSQDVHLVAGNAKGEMLAQWDSFNSSGNNAGQPTQKFYSYTLPNSGSLNPVQIGQVVYTAQDFVTNPPGPGDDTEFLAVAINSTGDVAGSYREFVEWLRWDGDVFRPVRWSQVWWIPKGGSLIKKQVNRELVAAIASAYPLGAGQSRADGCSFEVFDLNSSGVLLIGAQVLGTDTSSTNSRGFTEQVGATFNMVTGRINILFRTFDYGSGRGFAVRTGKINDKGQVALTRQLGGLYSEFYNGAGATGEPIPTVVGFKNMFIVNDLTSEGDVGGFEQIVDTPGVTGKAGIWKAAGSGEVIDVHAKLASPTVAQPYSSSVARLGDDGTIVGTVITKRLTNPDLPAGSDNPEVDWVRDFVIQAPAKN